MKRCSMENCNQTVPKKPIRGQIVTRFCRDHYLYGTANPFQEFPRQERIPVNVWDLENFSASLKQEYNFDKKGIDIAED